MTSIPTDLVTDPPRPDDGAHQREGVDQAGAIAQPTRPTDTVPVLPLWAALIHVSTTPPAG